MPLLQPKIKGGQSITNSVQNWDSTRKIPGDIILLAHYGYLLLHYFFVVCLKTKKEKNAQKYFVKLSDDQIILYELCSLLQSATTYNTTDLLPHHQVTWYFLKSDSPCLLYVLFLNKINFENYNLHKILVSLSSIQYSIESYV